jgi:hypothetical protein
MGRRAWRGGLRSERSMFFGNAVSSSKKFRKIYLHIGNGDIFICRKFEA